MKFDLKKVNVPHSGCLGSFAALSWLIMHLRFHYPQAETEIYLAQQEAMQMRAKNSAQKELLLKQSEHFGTVPEACVLWEGALAGSAPTARHRRPQQGGTRELIWLTVIPPQPAP